MTNAIQTSRPAIDFEAYDALKLAAIGCEVKLRCDTMIFGSGATCTMYTAYIRHSSWADFVRHESRDVTDAVLGALEKYRTKTVAISRGWR